MSVIVLVNTVLDRLQKCLSSIAASGDSDGRLEVLVLANGAPQTSLDALARRDDIVLISSAANLGFGGGCNWAARHARGELFLFVNDDVQVERGWLSALAATLDENPRIGVVGSRVLSTDGRLQDAGGVVWQDGSTSQAGHGLAADTPAALARRDVDFVSFSSAMVRREAWTAAGGFDERYYPAYYEDVDLCLTLRRLGWRVVYEPQSVVVHEGSASTTPHYRRFLGQRNQLRFVDKWGPLLAELEPRPSGADAETIALAALKRRAVVDQRGATDLAAVERVPRPGDVPPTGSPPAEGAEPRLHTMEVEAMGVELEHLRAEVAVKDEYLNALADELASFGTKTLLRKGYLSLRSSLVALLRRNRGVARVAAELRHRVIR